MSPQLASVAGDALAAATLVIALVLRLRSGTAIDDLNRREYRASVLGVTAADDAAAAERVTRLQQALIVVCAIGILAGVWRSSILWQLEPITVAGVAVLVAVLASAVHTLRRQQAARRLGINFSELR
ncbi:hypothetical protein [Gordonia sihwensis]|uniref:hypothetical protein n=1 Tax=Gordonia sihwensis TaxID=173559 RepID=UPI0005EE113E|nr:hypothetical protein [Gordonia sihwensis]KJR10461.1 hypothetical protein UG54_00210 [Gordonia sihwensis]